MHPSEMLAEDPKRKCRIASQQTEQFFHLPIKIHDELCLVMQAGADFIALFGMRNCPQNGTKNFYTTVVDHTALIMDFMHLLVHGVQ